MDIHTVEVQARNILEDLCRLCGAQEGRMLHLADTYTILGVSSSILHLIESISVLLKVQDDCEELMPKHLCFSCFNTAVDIQAFIDSGVNFQKTTIGQLYPNAKVEEAYELPLAASYHGESQVSDTVLSQYTENDMKIDRSLDVKPQGFLSCDTSFETLGAVTKENGVDKVHDHESTVEQDVDNNGHIQNYYQSSQVILESSKSKDRLCDTLNSKAIAIGPNTSSHSLQLNNSLSPSIGTGGNSQATDQYDAAIEFTKKESNFKQKRNGKKTQIYLKQDLGRSSLSNDCTDRSIKQTSIVQPSVSSTVDGRLKKCPACNKSFLRQSQLKSHLASHSEVRPYECNMCFLKFKYRRNLVEHSSIHNEMPSFICSVCGLTFKQKSNLLKHERTHREINKQSFKCNFCTKEYSQSSHLKTHLRNVHGDNCGYTCSECNVTVLCQSSLRRHMITVHAKSTKFTCTHCDKGFNNYQNYQGHIRRHTGERPYCCVICSKTFTTAKALSRHRLIHQGTKTHKCTHCSKAFLELCDLKRHVKRHLLKRVKKANKMSLVKCQENTCNPTVSVDPGMNSLNLMVLTDSLLFTESQQLLGNSDSRGAEVILPHDKLDTPKGVTAEPVMDPDNVIQPNDSNMQQGSMDLAKEPHMLRPEAEVLASSQLIPTAPDMEAVSLLANTAVLQPPEGINGITAPLGPSQVLHPTNIDVQDVVSANETNQVTLSARGSPECSSASEAPTMVMLSSVQTPEYIPVSAPENNSGNPVIDGERHQQSERVLSHATW